MAALIKNALIKHLSKFLKNVSANQINISTFKGEGEMKNIQLDENLLMDLMEIPTWLRITSARCNKAGIKIPWTKLKTNPIIIQLDKIELDVEIADPLREYTTNKDSKLFDKEFGGSYGFIDKCIDAIQLNIDSITVTLKSETFNMNLNMSNIYIYSTTPHWKTTNDIRNTRLKDLDKDEILIFKEFSWEICRLEAFNIDPSMPPQQQQASSIKLIMNPSKIQIAMKKKLSDKSMVSSTLRVLLNEIYWMASDTQLKSAIGTYNLIAKLMKKSFAQRRKYATLDQQLQQQQQQQQANKSKAAPTAGTPSGGIDISKVFRQYDVKETSMHMIISNLNIHLYADDNYSGNKLIDGGAMQLLFKDLCVDYYPYHRFGSSTRHWHNYNPTFRQREEWSKRLFDEFVDKIESILNKSCMFSSESLGKLRLKDNINLLEACTVCTLKDFCMFKVTTNMSNKAASGSGIKSKKIGGKDVNTTVEKKLHDRDEYTPNELLKNELYFIEQQMFNTKAFISSNYAEFNLPPETLFAQCFFSEFYFPQEANYPLPPAQIFIQVAPILVNVDFLTLLWINTLMFSLWREKLIQDENNVGTSNNNNRPTATTNVPLIDQSSRFNLHCDTFFEVLLPKVSLTVYPSDMTASANVAGFINRPSGVEVGFSRVVFSNQSVTRFADARKLEQLRSTSVKCYELAREIISKNSSDTNMMNGELDLNQLAPCFNHLLENENLYYVRYDFAASDKKLNVNITNEAHKAQVGLFLKSLNKNSLNKGSNKDIWLLECENMWLDFLGFVNDQNKSLVQNVSFKFWLVNVWDFYSTPDFLNSTRVERVEEIQEEENQKKLESTMKKLAEIIHIPDGMVDSVSKRRRTLLKQKRSKSLSVASKLVVGKRKSDYLCKKIYSKLNVIGELGDLHLSINHSKMLFLLRLMNVVDSFGEQMKHDTEQTLKHNNNNNNNCSTKDRSSSKDSNNNTTGGGGARLARINSMNMEDWFVNSLLEEKSRRLKSDNNDNIGSAEGSSGGGEPPFSVNLALAINSIQLELTINDLIPANLENVRSSATSQNMNVSDSGSIAAASGLALDETGDNISRRSFNLDSSSNTQKLASSSPSQLASKQDNLSNRSLDLLLDVKHSKHQIRQDATTTTLAQLTPIVHKDEFDVVYRQLDRDYMFSYIRFVYGVSTENPNASLAYQQTVASLQHQSMNQPQIMINSSYGAAIMNERLGEKDRSSSISSISSSVSNLGTSSTSSSTKTKTSFISSLAKSLKTPTKIPQQQQAAVIANDELGDDLASLMDDNDNVNHLLLAALEQDDNSSVMSLDVGSVVAVTPQSTSENLINKFSAATTLLKSKSMSSTNTASSSVDSGSLRLPPSNNVSGVANESGSSDQTKPAIQVVDQAAQTEQLTRNIIFRLGNIKVYAQTQDENVVAIVKLDEINMFEDKKAALEFAKRSKQSSKQQQQHQSPDIVLKYKKITNDEESRDGLVDLKLDSFQFDIDIPTVNGLVDLIDDTDQFVVHSASLTAKEMLLVNVHLTRCRFFLKEHPHSVIENNPKVLDLNIERLSLTKLPNNQIVIKDVQMKKSDDNTAGINNKSGPLSNNNKKQHQQQRGDAWCSDKLFSNLQSLIKFQHDYQVEKRISNAKSDKYASIVYMLRKSKEDQSNLRARLENERVRFEEERDELRMKLNLSQMENQELKKTIELARAAAATGGAGEEEFILADKKESAADQFDLERRQFESLLKQLEQENERLSVRLQKSEEHITILNIERECLMKNIDKIK